ncbi:MAG: argininosuccinate lyase [Acidimicrobiia bacterium]
MTLWGGRFSDGMSDVTSRFTGDTSDRRLLEVDIKGSLAHVAMLGTTGIISEEEAMALSDGLGRILAAVSEFEFAETDEDVHTAVERRLGELVGDVAGKLHTGRSRNDQVALDMRLYLRETGDARAVQLGDLIALLADLAEANAETPIPTYTHLQRAQVTTLGHHLLAHAWALHRDVLRFWDCATRLDLSPLGAGASAGSSLPLDPPLVAERLGFRGVMPNSLDAVGSRDFVSEYVFCCAQAMTDLSRLAEEVVLWAGSEFGWLTLGDEVSTGSSALPQKRNPDIAELVRGRTATVIGDATAILTLQKALPLAYNRDLQEDKRIVFHADDTLAAATEAMVALLTGVGFHPPVPGAETTALDLAEALVGRGVPFREAHEVVGRLVKILEDEGRSLGGVTADDLSAVDERFEPDDLDRLDPVKSLGMRVTPGSGSPQSVRDQAAALREALGL